MLKVILDPNNPGSYASATESGEIFTNNWLDKEDAELEVEAYNAGWAAAMGAQKE
jgi:hypothetical protein